MSETDPILEAIRQRVIAAGGCGEVGHLAGEEHDRVCIETKGHSGPCFRGEAMATEARLSLDRGIADAQAGRVSTLGSFAVYVDDDEKEQS